MRFLRRGLAGLVLLAVTLGFLASAVYLLRASMAAREAVRAAAIQAPARERVFAAAVRSIHYGSLSPELTAYGEVRSTRRLEIRAPEAGTLLELAPEFEEGGSVRAGAVLVQLDPAEAEAARNSAAASLAEAEASLALAERSQEIAADDLEAARRQADLREKAHQRQLSLNGMGIGSAAALEEAELAASGAAQAVLTKRAALSQAQAGLDQAHNALARARITLSEAQRKLDETTIRAEFDGRLASVTAVRGGVVAAKEMLAELIDPQALEVAFRVSAGQFAQLSGPDGTLGPIRAEVRLETADGRILSPAVLSRVGAAVEAGATGRQIFARLARPGGFRPGDFVRVRLAEPPLEHVARIPASALDGNDRVLALDGQSRLREALVEVLRREGDNVIIRASLPEGTEIVADRVPTLGEGILLRPMRAQVPGAAPAVGPNAGSATGPNPGPNPGPDAKVGAQTGADPASAERAPGGASPEVGATARPDAGWVTLAPERRARLIAFVQTSADIPAERKAHYLDQLRAAQVSGAVVQGLERRIGG